MKLSKHAMKQGIIKASPKRFFKSRKSLSRIIFIMFATLIIILTLIAVMQ